MKKNGTKKDGERKRAGNFRREKYYFSLTLRMRIRQGGERQDRKMTEKEKTKNKVKLN